MTLLAHSSHWATTLIEVAPFVILVGWLLVTTLRDRRQQARGDDGKRGT